MDRNIYYDINSESLILEDGSKTATLPHLVYGDKPNWVHYIKSVSATGEVSAVDVSDATSWEFAISDDLDKDTDVWVRVLDANIDDSDASNGKISVYIDSEQADFLEGIDGKYRQDAYARLKGVGTNNTYIFFYRIKASADVDPNSGTPGENPSLYYTKTENDALDMKLVSSPVNGHILTTDANGQAVDSGTSLTSITGGLNYQGTWDASTNTPTLTSSTGTQGHYYVVSTAGNTNLDGITDWQVADWVVFNGTTWDKVDNSDVGFLNPMTDAADIIVGGAGGTPTRLAKGSGGQVLRMNSSATAHEYATLTTADISDSTDKRYVTDDDLTTLANTSGVNTGDIYKATGSDVTTGTDDEKYVTSKALADASVTLQGNSFNGALQLVKLDASGKLPAVDGSQLLNLPSGFANPMTTALDIIVGGAGGTPTRLAAGSPNTYLRVNSSGDALEYGTPSGGGDVVAPATHAASYFPKWDSTANSKTLVEGVPGGDLNGNVVLRSADKTISADAISEITEDNGITVDGLKIKDAGIALGSDADGDIYYRSGGALARLAKGSAGQILKMNSGATAPTWGDQIKTVYIDAGAMVPCTTNGAASGTKEYASDKPEVDYFAFDSGATKERVQFKFVFPSNWDGGTITAKFYWSSATGSTAGDTCEWGIKAVCINNDDAMAATFGTAQTVSDTLLADDGADMQVSSATSAITIGGTPTVGSLICFEVFRNTDGIDNMEEDAWLFGVEITYGVV